LKIANQNLLARIAICFGLLLAVVVLPNTPLDPWGLFNPKKLATMVFALATLQFLGAAAVQYFGSKMGSLLAGFVSGLISSTATTASIAKRSSELGASHTSSGLLSFLAATAAMLFEGLILLLSSETEKRFSVLVLFLVPLLVTGLLVLVEVRKKAPQSIPLPSSTLQIGPLLKLIAFISVVISLSKLLQTVFGQEGVVALTFLASLFEIHGTLIANIQLFESESISSVAFSGLLTVSIAASFISKAFLVATLGSRELKKSVFLITALLLGVLLTCWMVPFSITNR
jgi:uncharacterized membrane protein (DUF4010 family)